MACGESISDPIREKSPVQTAKESVWVTHHRVTKKLETTLRAAGANNPSESIMCSWHRSYKSANKTVCV